MGLRRVVEVELLGARHAHDDVEDAELARRQRADHDAARAEALRAERHEARLGDDAAHAREHAALAAGALLVDFREERVRRVGDDGGLRV